MNRRLTLYVVVFVAFIMVFSMAVGAFPSSSYNLRENIQPANITSPISNTTITFTGDVAKDFAGHLVYHNTVTSPWGPGNNLSDLYVAYNETYIFIGMNESVSGNNLMVFLSNDTGSNYGLYNLSKLSVADGYGGPQGINFTSPVNALFDLYFSSPDSPSTPYLNVVSSTLSQSNSSASSYSVNFTYKFDGTYNSTEIAIPFSDLYPLGFYSSANLSLSAFVVGDGGKPGNWAWVGTGAPYNQTGKYNSGSTISMFTVNDSYVFPLHNITSKKIVTPKVTGVPINLAIVFNDHQPMYKVCGSDNYVLPWTEAHATAEYIEQALILHMFPDVNITYELSGSLLDQLVNISTDPNFNDTYIEGAFLPWSEVSNNSALYDNLTYDYFSIPNYVFELGEPASNLYAKLHNIWESGQKLNETQFEDVKVLWFLYDVSTPLVEGTLGAKWINSVMWSLHNQTSFNQSDLVYILNYSKWLTGQVIPAFRSDIMGNSSGSNNAELFTSPFYHPLVPLLLATNISGPQGTIYKSSYLSDVLAQVNISFGQFYHLFGEYPKALYSPEAAVSYGTIQVANETGAEWTQSAQATLDKSGVDAMAFGDSGSNVTTMENLYTPYEAVGANNSTVYMFFRDGYVSDQWGFDYGDEPTWTAVDNFINYLKDIYSAIPMDHHNKTVVTVLLDGENWMFMSPFAEDGVPFLMDLYTALEQNSSMIRTVTPSQYLHFAQEHNIGIPKLYHLATASWNAGSGTSLPYQSNIYLTQWSGDSVQDFYWQALQNVRSEVVSYERTNNLVQIQNYTAFEQNLTANTKEGALTRAWHGIYDAEGSDWYFTMAPWTIGGSNTIPFDYLFKGDLSYALKQIGLPIPAYLNESPALPLIPYKNLSTAVPFTPTLNGYSQYTDQEPGGLAFSVNNQTSWSYAAVYKSTGATTYGITNVSIDMDASDLFVQVNISGNPSVFVTNPNATMDLFFSQPNQGYSSNISMDVQSATFQTPLFSQDIGFPALYMVSIAPSTFRNGAGEYNVYESMGFGQWSYQFNDVNVPAYIGSSIQFLIPFSYINYVPGNSFALAVFETVGNEHSILTPIYQNIPLSLAQYTPISSIHNTVPDNGPGNYTYPEKPTQIPPGSLDLQWVNVSINSFDMKWVLTFGQLWNIWNGSYGFSNQIVNIFISDGSSAGSTYLGPGPNANSTEPWQTMLYISGFSTYAQTLGGTETNGIIVQANLSARTVTAVFPLTYVGSDPQSYKYVIVAGSYDGYGTNGWRIVEQSNTSNGGWQGGGGDPPWSSNIYDYIAPATVGEGNLTQQEALSYSVGHIPTVVPISLPSPKNVSVQVRSYFNDTSYEFPSLAEFNSTYYVSLISNMSGSNRIYLSESPDLKVWSKLEPFSGLNNVDFVQIVNSSSTLYMIALVGKEMSVYSTTDGTTWNLYFHQNITGNGIYASASGSDLFVLISTKESNGLYSYMVEEISKGKVASSFSVPFTGNYHASISAFGSYLAVATYNGSVSNESIYVNILADSQHNIVATVSANHLSNLTGTIALASDPEGNIIIAYTTNDSGVYTITETNASAFTGKSFRITTVLVSGTGVNVNPYIFLSNTGGSNYTLLMAFQTSNAFQNLAMAMSTSVSFHQAPTIIPKAPPKPVSYLFYIILGVVIAAVIAIAAGVMYSISRKKKKNQ